jgi:hypothetical protein
MMEKVIFEFKIDASGDRTATGPMMMCCEPIVMGMDCGCEDLEDREEGGLTGTLDFFEQLHEDLYG